MRGGGELGRAWHAAGRQLNKLSSVDDYLACMAHLLACQHTSRGQIAGKAFSAGKQAL